MDRLRRSATEGEIGNENEDLWTYRAIAERLGIRILGLTAEETKKAIGEHLKHGKISGEQMRAPRHLRTEVGRRSPLTKVSEGGRT